MIRRIHAVALISCNLDTKLLERDGFTIIPDVLDQTTIEELNSAIDAVDEQESVKRRAGRVYAIRNLFDVVPLARDIAEADHVMGLARQVIGERAFIARAILFDKNPEANWTVKWHQDTAIVVKQRIETPGFGPWSVKAGVNHVRPPAAILIRMITIRVHLDDCDETNGALCVVRGSHRHGLLATEPSLQVDQNAVVSCEATAGSAMLMYPLLLHASSAGSAPRRRRIMHLECAADPLPHGLQWARA